MQLSRRAKGNSYSSIEATFCLLCQLRAFSSSTRRRAEKEVRSLPPSPLLDAPRSYGKSLSEFTPKPLSRPIGLLTAPRAGENTGIDHRTLKQKREDFVNYDKHLAKRRSLTQKLAKSYFREWSNMRFHKGKSFLAPPRLFKPEKALYFPNLYGKTLMKGKELSNTTPLLEGKVTVVSVFSSAWAEAQVSTFVAEEDNPDLYTAVKESNGLAQLVHINVEENALKAMLIKLFMPSLRKRMGEANWGRYFIVRRGITDEIREAIGLLNSKVGYVYLLDGKCRIRWAGSGICEGEEKDGLVKGLRRLVQQAREGEIRHIDSSGQDLRKSSTEQKATITM